MLAWVTVPAAPRAGGHTTLYRIVNYLQAHGYVNRVYFYDVHNVDLDYYRQVLRRCYGFGGEVGSTRDGIADADAVIATSWQTAYPVFNARCSGRRCYFVQDFEADFHAAGSLSELARNTYRMGMHAITAEDRGSPTGCVRSSAWRPTLSRSAAMATSISAPLPGRVPAWRSTPGPKLHDADSRWV